MPFFPPYKTRFENGDLLFGLFGARLSYRDYAHFSLIKEQGQVYMIDNYSMSLEEMEVWYRDPIPILQLEFLEALAKHPKYGSAAGAPFTRGWAGMASYNRDMLRKKLKFGLEWMATNGRGGAVHFVLDDLNIFQVIHKSARDDGRDAWVRPDERARAATGVELRWIYRNRHDPRVQNCVQFWLDGKPCPPPWVDGFNGDAAMRWSLSWHHGYTPRSMAPK